MRIVGTESLPDPGVPLGKVAYGTVVKIARSPTLYLVISMMDGSGIKRLVTLGGGSLKAFPEDQPVQPVDAELRVLGEITPDSKGWNEVVPPWYQWPRKEAVPHKGARPTTDSKQCDHPFCWCRMK